MQKLTQKSNLSDDFAHHEYWMSLAIEEAKKAVICDEIPVGAVLIKNNEVIATAHNLTNTQSNPLMHAEKLVIEKAILQDKYLYDYTLYVTLEPCLMCAGLIILSRVGTLVFGASDPKAGACGSVYNVLKDLRFNHHPELIHQVKENECAQLLIDFFKMKRIIKNKDCC